MKTVTIQFPGISLLEVREQFKDCFYTKEDAWYDDQSFAKEKIPAGTYEVSLEVVARSFSKTFAEQEKLLEKGNSIPPAAVLVYALCTHFKDTGERAFENCYVRTSSVDSDGGHVGVGGFGAEGLGVGSFWGGYRGGGLGVASARKLDTGTLESLDPIEDLSLKARVAALEHWKSGVQETIKMLNAMK